MSIREVHQFFAECDECGEQDERFLTYFEARAHALSWAVHPTSQTKHLCEPCQDLDD
jgi:hypothetical protein